MLDRHDYSAAWQHHRPLAIVDFTIGPVLGHFSRASVADASCVAEKYTNVVVRKRIYFDCESSVICGMRKRRR